MTGRRLGGALVFAAIIATMAGCGGGDGGAPELGGIQFDVSGVTDNIRTIEVVIESQGGSTIRQCFAADSGGGTVNNVPSGDALVFSRGFETDFGTGDC